MSITNELREFASHCAGGMGGDSLSHIADLIDAEHESSEAFCRRLESAANNRDDVTLFGVDYTALPVDADGESIHIGDSMENNERVVRIMLTDGSWEPSVYTEMTPSVLNEYFCNEVSHYHKPTVEDVLREFGDWYAHTKGGCDEDGIIAEYASKLCLADDGKEQ